MKFNWNNNEGQNFCLNEKSCITDVENEKKMCLSFNKNDRTYIYVLFDDSYTHNSHDTNKHLTINSTDEQIETEIQRLTLILEQEQQHVIQILNHMKLEMNYIEDVDVYISSNPEVSEENKKNQIKQKEEAIIRLKEYKNEVDNLLAFINSTDSIITEYKIIKDIINKINYGKINSFKRVNFSYKLLYDNIIIDDDDYFERKLR
jgi:hypothetical protein